MNNSLLIGIKCRIKCLPWGLLMKIRNYVCGVPIQQCLLQSTHSVNGSDWHTMSTSTAISYLQIHYWARTSKGMYSLILFVFLGCRSSYCCSSKGKCFFRKDPPVHKPGLSLTLCFSSIQILLLAGLHKHFFCFPHSSGHYRNDFAIFCLFAMIFFFLKN